MALLPNIEDRIETASSEIIKDLVHLMNSTCGVCMDAGLAPKPCGLQTCYKIQELRIDLQYLDCN